MKYIFHRDTDGKALVYFLPKNGNPERLEPMESFKRIPLNHVFDFGDANSGTSQLSLAILLHHCTLNAIPVHQAEVHYTEFKWNILVRIEQDGGQISSDAVQFFLDQKIKQTAK